jgi:hypothetical protein
MLGTAAAMVLMTSGADGRDWGRPADPNAVLQAFHERVETYAALRRQLVPLAEMLAPGDQLARFERERYLAAAIRAARCDAQQGAIFTHDIETWFRQLVADSIGERDGEAFLAELNSGAVVPRGIHPTVNEPYSMTRVFRLPAEVRLGLPLLPAELDYRVAARDLLLWDVGAGIVVDFVPDAFTTRTVTE